jgi:hypothetical protein
MNWLNFFSFLTPLTDNPGWSGCCSCQTSAFDRQGKLANLAVNQASDAIVR